MTFDALDLAASSLNANFYGLLGRAKVHGKLDVAARDLSRFALIAGRTLKGEARIAADLDGAPRYGALAATLEAHATHLESGYPILDRITGGELDLTGGARSLPGGGFGFSNLLAAGRHGSARLDGSAARDKVDLNARIDVPQAQFLDPRIAGKAEVVAGLTGDARPSRREPEGYAQRGTSARSPDVGPRAGGARQRHHRPRSMRALRRPATSTASR